MVEDRTPATAPPGRSGDNALLGRVTGVRGPTEDALEEVTRAAEVKAMDILDAEHQGVGSGGAVEAVEGEEAEGDKGIEEGEAGGFVVVARDSKVRLGYCCRVAHKEAAWDVHRGRIYRGKPQGCWPFACVANRHSEMESVRAHRFTTYSSLALP